jgi:hypothetical protein
MSGSELQTCIRNFSRRPPDERGLSLFAYVKRHHPRVFAHHPDHPAFADHCFRVGGLALCRGCVMGAIGLVAGLVAWPTGWLGRFTDAETAVVFVALVLPTVVTSLVQLPRPVKDVSRGLLGFVTASAFAFLFVTDSWLARGVVLATFFAVRVPLSAMRRKHHRDELKAHGS